MLPFVKFFATALRPKKASDERDKDFLRDEALTIV